MGGKLAAINCRCVSEVLRGFPSAIFPDWWMRKFEYSISLKAAIFGGKWPNSDHNSNWNVKNRKLPRTGFLRWIFHPHFLFKDRPRTLFCSAIIFIVLPILRMRSESVKPSQNFCYSRNWKQLKLCCVLALNGIVILCYPAKDETSIAWLTNSRSFGFPFGVAVVAFSCFPFVVKDLWHIF